eukprot:3160303-Pleurochrysis_carterae.AAC.2
MAALTMQHLISNSLNGMLASRVPKGVLRYSDLQVQRGTEEIDHGGGWHLKDRKPVDPEVLSGPAQPCALPAFKCCPPPTAARGHFFRDKGLACEYTSTNSTDQAPVSTRVGTCPSSVWCANGLLEVNGAVALRPPSPVRDATAATSTLPGCAPHHRDAVSRVRQLMQVALEISHILIL